MTVELIRKIAGKHTETGTGHLPITGANITLSSGPVWQFGHFCYIKQKHGDCAQFMGRLYTFSHDIHYEKKS